MLRKRLKAFTAALVMASGIVSAWIPNIIASAEYDTGGNVVEYLDRGINAIKTNDGMFVSWRFNADDPDDAVFKLYRDGTLIYTSEAGSATSYLDKSGKSTSEYKVETLAGSTVISSDACRFVSEKDYFDLPLDIPNGGSDYSYTANDCSIGDVDGDGQYEIFVKWDPTNSQDNSKSGFTGNVYIDCYTLEGKKLWRIDLGKNIRAGAHYTQYLVADFDLDGKAEMCCKTADGTVDGIGTVIGDGSKDYRNASGYVLDGPEYYTLFDGMTGAALDTVNYEYPRGDVSAWGDKYGNRVDRFLGNVAYLDGVHPSAVSLRGYYTRMTIVAYDVVDKKLVKRWGYDSGNAWAANSGYGNGNHNGMAADVDSDGKDELVYGGVCIDDNGKVLWSTGLGHGDAMHLSDFLPDRPGLELWECHEHAPYGASLIDAKTGEIIFHYDNSKDTGRCVAGNIYAGNPGSEFWSAQSGTVYDGSGMDTGVTRPSMNFLIYWDGDLERELLDGTMISSINSNKQIDYIFYADDCDTCNSTKKTPCLTADLFGDWREELVLKTKDSKSLRIYCTPYTTNYRITTLMQDPQYRVQVATEQSGYNQPPHTSFYLGSDQPLPERPDVIVLSGTAFSIADGELIKSLEVYDKANRYSWSIQTDLKAGDTVFGDRSCKFTSVPELLQGSEWIRTSCNSKKYASDEASFTAVKDIIVYLGIDARAEGNASWLTEWTKTDLTMTDDGNPNVTYSVYKKDVKSGQQVTLGAVNMNTAVNYVIAAKEPDAVSTTEPTPTQPSGGDDVFIYGDLNYDGKINAFDMALMRQELLNGILDRSAKRRADVDADGMIRIADAVQLQSFLLKGSGFSANAEKKMFLYACDQQINEGVEESINEGFRDKAYVNLDNKIGSNIVWSIMAPIDGNYLCTFGIANGSSDNRKMKIEVNDQSDFWVQDFLPTGAWTTWEERGIVLPLKKGNNTIRMTSFIEQGGPNLDYMQIEWTDEPVAEVYTEPQVTVPDQSEVSRTIYIAGDSTVQTYKASYAPQQGWGAYLEENMPQGVSVSNHAIAGRSSKSFYDNGRLDTILNSIQEDDYLLVQFGINDSAASKAERYAPTCGSVPGTSGSFEYYMAKYIEGAKEKGVTPILVTTVIGLKAYDSTAKKFTGSYSNYCNAMKQLADYYDIPCIDLNSLMVDHYNSIGYDTAYTYHMCSTGSTDMTHFTETGAKAVAKLVADEMKKQGLC